MENNLARLDRIGIEYNLLKEEVNGYWINTNKKGNLSWCRAFFNKNPVINLNTCQLCGKVSTPKKVQTRIDCWGWNRENKKDYSFKSKHMLCMSCWNKVKPIVNRKEESEELRLIINRLNRERLKCQKLQKVEN